MNNIKSLLNQIEVEDILKMIETEYFGSTPTIKIPWHSLEQGQMIPYLRSLERRKILDRGPFLKLSSQAFEFHENDFNFNVVGEVNTKKFMGFQNSSVSSLEFVTSEEMIIQDYIDKQVEIDKEKGRGTIRTFFEQSYLQQTFQYMENFKYPQMIFDFDKYGCNWNLSEECNLPGGLSGISSPWFYVGSRHSLFPLHLEDNNLRSINIHLGGKPKVWIGFHQDDIETVENILQQFQPANDCMFYHRHKHHFINPGIFTHIYDSVPVYMAVQHPGEAILTNSFHQGFNLGVNYNLAINFMLSSKDFKMANNGRYCGQDCKYDEKRSILKDIRLGYCLTCDICSKKFTSSKGLKEHYPKAHKQSFPETAKLGTCGLCGKSFRQPEVHLKNHHKIDLPKEMCGLCRQTFRNQTEVRKHWTSEHHKRNRTCNFCEETFDRLQDAQYHNCEKDSD